MSIKTDLLHDNQVHQKLWGDYKSIAASHTSPIYQTTTFILDDFDSAVYLNQHVDQGFVYSRFGGPSSDELERKVAHLEHAEAALALASGLGAISTAALSCLKAGDHVVFGDVICRVSSNYATRVHRSAERGGRHSAQHHAGLRRDAGEPDAEDLRHRGDRQNRPRT